MSIIVCHRSVTNRRIFANALRKGGYEASVLCGSRTEAAEALEGRAALLIIQKEMAMQEGAMAVGMLRGRGEGDTAVLLVGYDFTEREAVQAIRQGAGGVLLLPFAPEELHQRVEKLVPQAA